MFNVARILDRKRRGGALSAHEIRALIAGYVRGDVHDYQMAAFTMAVCCRGMDAEETATLTESMWRSGETLAWPEGPPVVDKHSTGGIGDKSSLVLAPLLADFGVRVPMISGRGLGPTGGTLDKLESIPGFRVRLSNDDFRRVVAMAGCAIVGQTMDLAPADRMLYALRDATGTVDSTPLIVASILAKKLAAGLDRLVLDVKFGTGAFGRTPEQASELASALTSTAQRSGLATTALVTSMDQPTGRAVGNALEVQEALATLAGHGPPDLAELVSQLGAELLAGVGRFASREAAAAAILAHLKSGAARARFERMVAAQGGDPSAALPAAKTRRDFAAKRDGWLIGIDGARTGYALIALGGGRRAMTDSIDPAVGFEFRVRLGDRVAAGQPLLVVHENGRGAEECQTLLGDAFSIGDEPRAAPPLLVERSGN